MFLRSSAAERRTLLHAAAVLLFVEATIRWMRLPRLTRILGVAFEPEAKRGPGSPERSSAPSESTITGQGPAAATDLPASVAVARRSVDRLMRIWPLGSGPCLRESLVLGHLIRARSPVLRLGVARHGYRLRAHAWVELAGRPVNDPKGFVAFEHGSS